MDNNLITPEYLREEYEKLEKAKAEFYEERENSGLEYKLFVGSIDPDTTDEQLREYFSPYGPLKQCWILRKDGISRKSGFVKYYYKHSAEAAIEALNGKITDKKQKGTFVVRYANAKGTGFFPPSNAPSTVIVTHPHQTYHYLNHPNPMDMPQNSMHPQASNQLGMQPTQSTQSQVLGNNRSPVTRGPMGANLYVNHLKPGVTESDLRNLFSTLGNVISTRVYPGRYGFVSLDNIQAAQRAITHLNGTQNLACDGHVLEVSFKKDKENGPMHHESNLSAPQHGGNPHQHQLAPTMNYMVLGPQMMNNGLNTNGNNNSTSNQSVMSLNRPYF